jgi:sec-independent protein translocase protein TatB
MFVFECFSQKRRNFKMFDLGMQELILIFIIALLVFGPKRLPELGRTLGKGIRELKTAIRGVQESIIEEEADVLSEIKEVEASIKESINEKTLSNRDTKEETTGQAHKDSKAVREEKDTG